MRSSSLQGFFLAKKVKQDVIHRLADGGIVCQDFIAKPCGAPIGQFLADTVQKGVCIVIENVIVPYEGHFAYKSHRYLTSFFRSTPHIFAAHRWRRGGR